MDEIRLRPHSFLFRRGMAAVLAFFVPAFVVLYALTIPSGPWQLVLVGQLIVMLMLLRSMLAYRRLGVWVSPTRITEQGFFFRSSFDASELGSTVLVNTYHGGWTETVPQLFVCDPAGKQLIRLRGQFWSRDVMVTITDTLGTPSTTIERDMSMSELHAANPGLLYWFERRPMLAGVIFAGVILAVGAGLYAVLAVVGVIGA